MCELAIGDERQQSAQDEGDKKLERLLEQLVWKFGSERDDEWSQHWDLGFEQDDGLSENLGRKLEQQNVGQKLGSEQRVATKCQTEVGKTELETNIGSRTRWRVVTKFGTEIG